ncbi:MAG: hypothetical protein ACLQGU_17460 [bacterium]
MVSKGQGKSMIKEIVERYRIVEKYPGLIKGLSEQDITTKFVLPMFDALNWDYRKITKDGPEVHEKAYREKSRVGKGLPDVQLKSANGNVFIEVKRPPLRHQGMANLERYEDGDVTVLTSFEDLEVYIRHGKQKPRRRFKSNFKNYIEKFDRLWEILSNTQEGKHSRAGYKSTRKKA